MFRQRRGRPNHHFPAVLYLLQGPSTLPDVTLHKERPAASLASHLRGGTTLEPTALLLRWEQGSNPCPVRTSLWPPRHICHPPQLQHIPGCTKSRLSCDNLSTGCPTGCLRGCAHPCTPHTGTLKTRRRGFAITVPQTTWMLSGNMMPISGC